MGTTTGEPLLLTKGGTIQADSFVTNPQVVNAPLVLEGGAGAYSFESDSNHSGAALTIGGSITAGAAGIMTINLSGSSTLNNSVNGLIGNGGGTVAIAKNGAGEWMLNASSTYTGGIAVSGGTLAVGPNGNLGGASNFVSVFGNATLDLGNTTQVAYPGVGSGGVITNGTLTNNAGTFGIFRGTVSAVLAGTQGVEAYDTGTLSGNNTFTGPMLLGLSSVLNVTSVSDYGAPSAIGARPAGADNASSVGLLFNGGTLRFIGATEQSTNRALQLLGSTGGGGTLESSGTAPVHFTATSSPNFDGSRGFTTLSGWHKYRLKFV